MRELKTTRGRLIVLGLAAAMWTLPALLPASGSSGSATPIPTSAGR